MVSREYSRHNAGVFARWRAPACRQRHHNGADVRPRATGWRERGIGTRAGCQQLMPGGGAPTGLLCRLLLLGLLLLLILLRLRLLLLLILLLLLLLLLLRALLLLL